MDDRCRKTPSPTHPQITFNSFLVGIVMLLIFDVINDFVTQKNFEIRPDPRFWKNLKEIEKDFSHERGAVGLQM